MAKHLYLMLCMVMFSGCVTDLFDKSHIRVNVPEFMKLLDGMPDGLGFSKNNEYVALTDADKKIAVFARDGHIVKEAVDDQNQSLKAPFAEMFSTLIPLPEHADFIKGAGGRGFDDGGTNGIRMVSPISVGGWLDETTKWSLELWQLKPEKKLQWQREFIPDTSIDMRVNFFDKEDGEYILISVHGENAYVFSKNNGKLVETLELGALLPLQPGRSFSWVDERIFDPARRLIAYTSSANDYICVVSLDNPRQTVWKDNLNKFCTPFGAWFAQRLEFAGGKYLIVEYVYESNLPWLIRLPTRIYNVDTWKEVWSENSIDIRNVCLSPDGKTMAFLRDRKYLEIRAFEK